MKRLLFAALFAITIPAALAADVGVSVNVGQPGFYGRIEIGDAPRPRLLLIDEFSLGLAPVVVDRLARRYVIDFVEWHWWNRPDLRWPTFNLADSLIVVGVAMLLLHPGEREGPPGETAGGGKNRARPGGY